MEEKKDKTQDTDTEQKTPNIDTTISDTILDFQSKYEEEHKLRLKAEQNVADLSRLVRTMGVSSGKQEEKEETLDDKINKLFK